MSEGKAETKEQLDEESLRKDEEHEKQHMRLLRNKHPDCIPVYFAKHREASKSLPEPATPFMLFKKDLKIEQAMYRVYEQVQTKPLYFFCLQTVQEKAKYVRLKAGPTIEELYRRYGKNQSLILIYADSELGMQGIKNMERCLMWILGILALIWGALFGYNYLVGWTSVDSSTQAGKWEEIN